jgi:hypothetical protein
MILRWATNELSTSDILDDHGWRLFEISDGLARNHKSSEHLDYSSVNSLRSANMFLHHENILW